MDNTAGLAVNQPAVNQPATNQPGFWGGLWIVSSSALGQLFLLPCIHLGAFLFFILVTLCWIVVDGSTSLWTAPLAVTSKVLLIIASCFAVKSRMLPALHMNGWKVFLVLVFFHYIPRVFDAAYTSLYTSLKILGTCNAEKKIRTLLTTIEGFCYVLFMIIGAYTHPLLEKTDNHGLTSIVVFNFSLLLSELVANRHERMSIIDGLIVVESIMSQSLRHQYNHHDCKDCITWHDWDLWLLIVILLCRLGLPRLMKYLRQEGGPGGGGPGGGGPGGGGPGGAWAWPGWNTSGSSPTLPENTLPEITLPEITQHESNVQHDVVVNVQTTGLAPTQSDVGTTDTATQQSEVCVDIPTKEDEITSVRSQPIDLKRILQLDDVTNAGSNSARTEPDCGRNDDEPQDDDEHGKLDKGKKAKKNGWKSPFLRTTKLLCKH